MNDLKEIAKYAIEAMRKAGADESQCAVSSGVADEFNIDSGEVSLMRSLFDSHISMKVIKNHKKGVIAVNQIDRASIDRAAADCVAAAEASVEDDAVCIASFTRNAEFDTGIHEADKNRFFDRVKEYLEDVTREFPKVMLEQVIATYHHSDVVFANSNGVEYLHSHGDYNLSSMFSAHDGDSTTSFNYCEASFTSLDGKILDIGMQRVLYDQCQRELEAKNLSQKFTGTAVLAPYCLADLLSEALGSFTGGNSIIDKTSPWIDKLGQKVASEKLTIAYAPLDERIIGGERITDDGYIAEDYSIIEKGILNYFDLTEYDARKTGLTRSPNSSGVLRIEQGDTNLDGIIAGIDNGILVCRFSGGSPASNGDFSGVAKNSFLIRGGKLAGALTETMISGNLSEMLQNVRSISSELVCDGSSILPYIAFDGVVVSGNG